jgi:uncharacterized RDD family membrane protein YckC
MGCPKCQCNEISDSGMCLWCGYQVIAPAAESKPGPKEDRDFPGQVEMDNSHPPAEPAREELPQWRQELSQNLLSIKPKREESAEQVQAESKILPVADSETPAPEQSSPPTVESDSRVHPHPPLQETRRQPDSNRESLPAASAAPPESKRPFEREQFAADTGLKLTDSQDTQGLIDSVTSRQPRQREVPPKAAEVFSQSPAAHDHGEGRMILVSRTLSGLMDLIIMALSTGALIIAADFFSGIRVLDLVSVIHYLELSLLVYFTYSLFFLEIVGQTIGMMIMNLQVVAGTGEMRLRMRRLLLRCFCYLVSVLFLGIGLLWALFDPECQCLHDRLTNTHVVRVDSSASKTLY